MLNLDLKLTTDLNQGACNIIKVSIPAEFFKYTVSLVNNTSGL